MSVISCPSCRLKMRVPDSESPRKAVCPSCGHAFMAEADPSGGANEPDSGGKSSGRQIPIGNVRPPEPAINKVASDSPVVKRRSASDDDNERLRANDGDRNADYDDQSRAKKRPRGEEIEVDEAPAKRVGKGGEDDVDRPRSRRCGQNGNEDNNRDDAEVSADQFLNAAQGVGLIGIGFWCQVGALGVLGLFAALGAIFRLEFLFEVRFLYGVPGFANWALALVGIGFLISGPRSGKLFRLNIMAMAVAGLQLILTLYLTVDVGAFFLQKAAINFGNNIGIIMWEALVTVFFHLQVLLLMDVYPIWPVLCVALELTRFVLVMLIVRELAIAVKRKNLRRNSMEMVVALPTIFVVSTVIFKIIIYASRDGSSGKGDKGAALMLFIMLLALYVCYLVVYCKAAIVCRRVRAEIIDRKT